MKCCYAEFRILFIALLNVIMLNVVMLNVRLNVVRLNVVMLNVIGLNAVILSVVAPSEREHSCRRIIFYFDIRVFGTMAWDIRLLSSISAIQPVPIHSVQQHSA
jgi:hypothetical protein